MPEMQEIKDSLHRILFYIENDPKTGRKGIITDVEDIKTNIIDLTQKVDGFIVEYNKAQAIKNAKIGLISSICGGIAACVVWLIKMLA